MQKSFWWWQCSDKYIYIYIHTHNLPLPPLHIPSPLSPSLIGLVVSVDVQHHVHLLTKSRGEKKMQTWAFSFGPAQQPARNWKEVVCTGHRWSAPPPPPTHKQQQKTPPPKKQQKKNKTKKKNNPKTWPLTLIQPTPLKPRLRVATLTNVVTPTPHFYRGVKWRLHPLAFLSSRVSMLKRMVTAPSASVVAHAVVTRTRWHPQPHRPHATIRLTA